jgi:predicted nucleotidyltransferase
VQCILKEVISFYRNYLPKELLVFEFGSFVKNTERIFSDIDFTICYDEHKTEKYECVEEIIDYTLAEIFGFSIDHVHGKFQHYPEIPKFNSLTEQDNHYRLIFDKGNFVDYKCGPETLIENLTNIKNVRNYESMITGYEEKYKNKIDIDCLYSIEIFENTTAHDFLFDLSKLEEKYDICEGYQFKLNDSKLDEEFSISDVKRILKHDGIVEFYTFIAKLRKIARLNDSYSMNMDMLWNNESFIYLFGMEYLTRLKESFISFIFYWNRIELSLHSRGIALSTRCYKKFSFDEMNQILNSDWKKTTNIETIISSKNKLIQMIQEGLAKL